MNPIRKQLIESGVIKAVADDLQPAYAKADKDALRSRRNEVFGRRAERALAVLKSASKRVVKGVEQ